jgi:poly(3-hydroxybutyrate) depolymerase
VRFSEIRQFGSNPARLRMFNYLPSSLGADAALVVVLHGCRQTAKEFGVGAGWPALAQRFGSGADGV